MQFGKSEIHTVFLDFPNFLRKQNFSLSALADLIRASLIPPGGNQRPLTFPGEPTNWCLARSAHGFPFGEAGTPIGSSEPIGVTEEVWYRVSIRCAVGKEAAFRSFSIYYSVFAIVAAG